MFRLHPRRGNTSTLLLALLLAAGCAQVLGIEDTQLVEAETEEPDETDTEVTEDANTEETDEESDVVETDATETDQAQSDAEDPSDAGVTDIEEEPEPTPDPGEDFRCVGDGPLQGSEADEIEIIARIVDIATAEPLQGIVVTSCRTRLDLSCSGGSVDISDESGLARVTVPNGFDGYLKVEGGVTGDAGPPDDPRVGYLWYFSQPLTDTYVFPIFSMTESFRDIVLYGTGSVDRDPSRGEIAINVTDCSTPTPETETIDDVEVKQAPGVNAPGVHLDVTDDAFVDEQTESFYFSDNLFAFPADREDQVTDAAGLGGFLNLKPGSVPIEAIVDSTMERSARDRLLVVAGFLTTVRLLPE